MKKVVIINGHPNKESFNYVLAKAYKEGADKVDSAEISQIDITDLKFNPILKHGYNKRMELEPDLIVAIDKIKNADHIVWVFPMWWFGYPALMKGFIERTFLPSITFNIIEGKTIQEKLLKGKTARIIVTSDTPRWYDYLFMKSPALNQFKKGTLAYCGVGPTKVTYLAAVKNSKSETRKKWLKKIKTLGEKMV